MTLPDEPGAADAAGAAEPSAAAAEAEDELETDPEPLPEPDPLEAELVEVANGPRLRSLPSEAKANGDFGIEDFLSAADAGTAWNSNKQCMRHNASEQTNTTQTNR